MSSSVLKEIMFLGTGEACDETRGNTSILLQSESEYHLFDCGFTAAHAFYAHCPEPEKLASLWISHFHGDHFYGVPLLLLRMHEKKRTTPLTIVSAVPAREKIAQLMELAYPGFMDKITFQIHYILLDPAYPVVWHDMQWQCSLNVHSLPSFSVRIDTVDQRIEQSFGYSGDGKPTTTSETLFKDCDLLVHEAFTLQDELENHGSVQGCLELMQKTGCKKLALVHLARETRLLEDDLRKMVQVNDTEVIIANDGQRLIFGG